MELLEDLGARIVNGNWVHYAIFKCPHCFQEVVRQLNNGKIQQSCGCVRYKLSANSLTKHGEYKTKLYAVWADMKQRILNPKRKAYKDYGGRGITICNEWLEFIPFRDWALNNGYAEGLQINRIENDGNYEPSNCDWATRTENMRNRGCNVIKNIEEVNEIRELYATGNYTQKELAKKYGVSSRLISFILNNKIWRN